jgi:hypothetical protein
MSSSVWVAEKASATASASALSRQPPVFPIDCRMPWVAQSAELARRVLASPVRVEEAPATCPPRVATPPEPTPPAIPDRAHG